MKQILVYGDSLSWGIIPTTRRRQPFDRRWPGVMELALNEAGHDVRVIEDCLNGRRTVWEDPYKRGRNGLAGIAERIEIHSPLALVKAEPTRTPTPVPTPTRQPGIGINIPGPQGTPTPINIPLPIPGLGANGTPGALGSPVLPITIPGLNGTPGLPPLPGASGTAPPNAKLTADGARQKVKDSISNCRLLQTQVEASQVTFEPPTWTVRLPLTGTSWKVDDETGAVTPDERAAERARTCRL